MKSTYTLAFVVSFVLTMPVLAQVGDECRTTGR